MISTPKKIWLLSPEAIPLGSWAAVVALVLMLLPQDAWARSRSRAEKRARSLWSRIAFSDEEPDLVPAPPRDEAESDSEANDEIDNDEVQGEEESLNSDLFDEVETTDGELETVETAESLLGDDLDRAAENVEAENAHEYEQFSDDLDPLPPQREYFDPGVNTDAYASGIWQIMPSGLMYRSYLAGEKEPRLSSVWMKDQAGRTVWENTLGARVGLLRYGTVGAYRPQGFQFDLEGAALARVLPGTESTMLEATDYRAGLLATWAEDQWHVKVGYYHLSSHLGDEFVIANPLITRFNYVRDSAVAGVTYDITDDWQTYGEIAYAMSAEDGAEPLEFQYGVQYSPMVFGLRGAPFAAINGHTREDFDFATSVNVQAGWQWRGSESQKLLRAGFQYYSGPALQYSFPGQNDRLLGGGIWIDF